MNIALISLAVLIAAILIGFFRKMNVGLIAILAVTIFASFISSTDKDVIKGFWNWDVRQTLCCHLLRCTVI